MKHNQTILNSKKDQISPNSILCPSQINQVEGMILHHSAPINMKIQTLKEEIQNLQMRLDT